MQWLGADPITSKKLLPSDDVPRQMLVLLVELLRSMELPELAIGGAWMACFWLVAARPGLCGTTMELGVVELAVEHLRAIGSPADMVTISRRKNENWKKG